MANFLVEVMALSSPFSAVGRNLPDGERPISPLDYDQWSAAALEIEYRMVFGGPGTGKTRTILARTIALLEAGEPAESLTVLTFSARAAHELRRAIEAAADDKGWSVNPEDVFVGTLGYFCLGFLRRFGCPNLNLPSDFILWDPQQCESIIEGLSHDPQLRRKTIPRDELRRLMQWNSLNRHRDTLRAIPAPDSSWHRLEQGFRQAKNQRIALDLDDLLEFTISALQNDEDLCERVSEKCARHLMVDDFQEYTPLQDRLLRLLTRHSNTVTVAGDPNQFVHCGRGADLGPLARFRNDHQEHKPFVLPLNHRATGHLVTVAQVLQESTALPAIQTGHQKKVRILGDPPRLLVHQGPIWELDQQVVDIIESLNVDDGYAFEDIAVLYPNSTAERRITTRLQASRTPYQVLEQRLFPAGPDYDLAVSLLRVVAQPKNQAAFQKAATAGLHKDQIERFETLLPLIVDIAERQCCDLASAAALFVRRDIRKTVIMRRLRQIVHAVEALRHASSAPGVDVASIVGAAGEQAARIGAPGSVPILSPTLYRLIAAAESYTGSWRRTLRDRLIGFLDHLALSSDPLQRTPVSDPFFYPPDGVALGTLRSAQGRQWKAVLLIDCIDEAIPGDRDDVDAVDIDEPQRLFYVAVTRPTDKLYLFCPSFDEASTPQRPSRFIAPISHLLV